MMTKEEREATIKALSECSCSGFTAADQKLLESVSDERLVAFQGVTNDRKKTYESFATLEKETEEVKTKLKDAETKLVAAEAKLGAVETKLKAAEAKGTLTEEEFMAVAPSSLKTLIERSQKADETTKADLVTTLKAAQSEFTEAELQAEPIERLQRMARALKLDEPKPDYSGRPLPRAASKGVDDYTPPNPYEKDLKALQARNLIN